MKKSRRTISWSTESEERKLVPLHSATCLQRACHLLNHKVPYFWCSTLHDPNQEDLQTVPSSAGVTHNPTQTEMTRYSEIRSQPPEARTVPVSWQLPINSSVTWYLS